MIRKRQDNTRSVQAELEAEVGDLAAVLTNYGPGKRPCFGAPSRCPDCSDFGMVTGVDHVLGRCENRCTVCTREWVITVRALDEHARRPDLVVAVHRGTGALAAALAAAATGPRPRSTERRPILPSPRFGRSGRTEIRPA